MTTQTKTHTTSPIHVEQYLKGMNYPARKEDLLQCAKKNNAPQKVLDQIQNLGTGEYHSPIDVSKAFGRQK